MAENWSKALVKFIKSNPLRLTTFNLGRFGLVPFQSFSNVKIWSVPSGKRCAEPRNGDALLSQLLPLLLLLHHAQLQSPNACCADLDIEPRLSVEIEMGWPVDSSKTSQFEYTFTNWTEIESKPNSGGSWMRSLSLATCHMSQPAIKRLSLGLADDIVRNNESQKDTWKDIQRAKIIVNRINKRSRAEYLPQLTVQGESFFYSLIVSNFNPL